MIKMQTICMILNLLETCRMATMWEAMHTHHSDQYKLVAALRACDVSLAPRETSDQHHDITIQLWNVVREWNSQFQNLVTHQKEYIQALNSWLKLNIIPIESNLKEKVSSPAKVAKPPIQDLLRAWLSQLEKLPEASAKSAILSFSEVIHTIVILQDDELKLKERCEETRKEFIRKKRYFDEWRRRYMERKMAASARENEEGSVEASNEKDLIEGRRFVVESVEVKLKSEEETYLKTCKQVREKSVGSLRNHLPELFRAMSDFSFACAEMYGQLRSITLAEKTGNTDQ
ncbi:hypothetical protein HPP92_027303 [Vanilla planifolia]|uniref:DUF632 domain-containing protein n=1 Tax=Vanilla planifolia TaxID=51239 RepID=A0A835U693_VANPL|nr:hypothetical protein HPP92_027303 [Vanilla planifolia]